MKSSHSLVEFMVIWLDLTGKSKVLLNKGGLPWFVGPVASPDGRMLVYSKQSNDVNLFLLVRRQAHHETVFPVENADSDPSILKQAPSRARQTEMIN